MLSLYAHFLLLSINSFVASYNHDSVHNMRKSIFWCPGIVLCVLIRVAHAVIFLNGKVRTNNTFYLIVLYRDS